MLIRCKLIRCKLSFSEEYALLKSLSCGGYTNVLQDAVVWFSSGGTKSVLHYDSVDNINCLFDGTKELVMINKVGFSTTCSFN